MTTNTDAKRNARYSRQAVKAKLQETLSTNGSFEYLINEDDESSLIVLPHPFFYDKATKQALSELAADDEEGRAKVRLGEEQYAKLVELGGDGADIDMVYLTVQRDSQDALAEGPSKK